MATGFNIWKVLSVVHAVFGIFVDHISVSHCSPVLDLIFALNSFDSASLRLQHSGYLFDDEILRDFGESKEACRKISPSKLSRKAYFM